MNDMKDMKALKDIVQNWLDNASLANVQACCIRIPSGECYTQVVGNDFNSDSFDRAITNIATIVPALTRQGFLPGQVVWSFAKGKLFYAVRPDSVALGLFCGPDGETNSSAVDGFIADFMASPEPPSQSPAA
jgi:hypothetical protein